MSISKIILKSNKENSVRRFHPWIFSGAIFNIEGNVQNGDVVQVCTGNGEILGIGHWSEGSISVRLFDFGSLYSGDEFWFSKFESAFQFRKTIGFINNKATNIYRLINAEGDGLPGLVVDMYGDTAVVQSHSLGMHKLLPLLQQALVKMYGTTLKSIYDKSAEKLKKSAGVQTIDQYIMGSGEPSELWENGHRFHVDWETGQKTGFFIDQRENRKLLGNYSSGMKILNAFCYSGAFSVYALANGAAEVHSLDSSQKALDLTLQNIQANKLDSNNHQTIKADAVDFLNNLDHQYDIIVLDPPAFAKHLSARHKAIQGYKRINEAAIKKIKPGGLIFTFSCSQAIDKEMFRGAIMSAAINSRRKLRIVDQLNQPPDHPINIYHPESEYLKGLVLQVE